MDEHTAKTPKNRGSRNMKLVYDAPSFSLGLTQEYLVTVVSNPLQLTKSGRSKEIRSKFYNDEVKMTDFLKKKGLKKTPSPKEQKAKKRYEKNRKSKEIEDDVDKYYDEFEEENSSRYKDFPWGSLTFEDLARSLNNRLKAGGKFYLIQGMPLAIQVWLYECCSNVPPKIALKVENRISRLLNWKTIAPRPWYEFLMNAMFKDNGKVIFKNIVPTKMELAKLEIPQKDDPPPKKINERSKKKKKVDSSTPAAKKPSEKKQVNIVDVHTQTRTPPHRVAKATVMKTPVFKPILTQQASSLKKKEGKQTARVIFPQVQSTTDSHVEKVAVSKRERHVEKETFISKKVRQEFKEVREEFTRIHQLVKKKFKKMIKAIEHSKGCTDSHPDKINIEINSQHLILDELFQSINLDYNFSEKIVHHDDRITDEKLDDSKLSDSQFTIPDELLPSLNAYRRESITTHPLATSEEEQINKYFNDKKSEFVVQDHCQENKENVGLSSKADMHGEVDLGTDEQIMKNPKIQELTTDEQRDETILPDSQDKIPDDLLPSLNVYSSKSIIVHRYANCELQTPLPKLRIRRPSKFKESPYMVKFGSAAESSKGHIRIFPQKHPFLYHPIDGIMDTKIVNKFMDWISENLLKVHAKRYAALLWDYGTKKQDVNAHSDIEAPLRPPRQNRITSVSEVFDG
ncbi:uncharacterized protein LOC107852634 [Capsicum annuum]|uniref:uncharacterized protein LOC107852634 n=1 Tax=Capsicum annuum TaxID=4072 RepID=UPI001FB0FE38|nr:uncharacterized protein LOC107852634 [Capsicum annuum]